MKKILILLGVLAASLMTFGVEIHVDHEKGNDKNTGTLEKPLKTIRAAVVKLAPGDRLIFAQTQTPYPENLVIRNLSGTAAAPIVIEGQNAVLRGSKPIDPAEFTDHGDGLYSKPLQLRGNQFSRRFNLVIDGKLERMGRAAKLNKAGFTPPTALLPGEWSYDINKGELFIKIKPEEKLTDHLILEPDLALDCGIKLAGKTAHVKIQNLTVEYFWNDGVNLHHECKAIELNNLKSRFNGDDGLSAHENCEFTVNNFVSRGNTTGICHVQSAKGVHTNIDLADAAAIELYLLDQTENHFENLTIRSSAPSGVIVKSPDFTVKNATITYVGPPKETILPANAAITDLKIVNGKE